MLTYENVRQPHHSEMTDTLEWHKYLQYKSRIKPIHTEEQQTH